VATATEFYDTLASGYDRMTGFDERLKKETNTFRRIVEEYAVTSALDAGCGTGAHSVLLATLGVRVTAVDGSTEMLMVLNRHAEERHLKIHTVQAGFENVNDILPEPFDAVFCLGNTLPHLLTEEALVRSLRNFKSLLNPGGVLILQLLNYRRILTERNRILNVQERGERTYIRFYDFLEKTVAFSILTLEKHEGTIVHSLQTTELRPWQSDEVVRGLAQAGFSGIERYSTLGMASFDETTSHDLVMYAR